jgi:hypothetical protein
MGGGEAWGRAAAAPRFASCFHPSRLPKLTPTLAPSHPTTLPPSHPPTLPPSQPPLPPPPPSHFHKLPGGLVEGVSLPVGMACEAILGCVLNLVVLFAMGELPPMAMDGARGERGPQPGERERPCRAQSSRPGGRAPARQQPPCQQIVSPAPHRPAAPRHEQQAGCQGPAHLRHHLPGGPARPAARAWAPAWPRSLLAAAPPARRPRSAARAHVAPLPTPTLPSPPRPPSLRPHAHPPCAPTPTPAPPPAPARS